jgi:hypothetical protein
VTRQASRKQAAKVTALALYGVFGLAAVAGAIAWFVWRTAISVIVAVGLAGLAALSGGTLLMAVTMMMTRYPLDPPDDDAK